MQIVKHLKQYKIPFSGLAAGAHDFEFEIDNTFFDCYTHSIVKKGSLKAHVKLEKQENMLIVHYDIQGHIMLTCDVCLSEFEAPLQFTERTLVKFADEDWDNSTEEVIVLAKTDYELYIADLLYEFINVRVPYYNKCSEQGNTASCDPEMLARISSPENQKDDAGSGSKKEEIDPRWEALKHIKNN